MGFLPLAIVVWMAAMLGWYVISKYFKSSDADKIKQRLMGVGKAARQKAKEAKSGEQSVIHTQQSGNKFAQLLVEKYQLGPKMQLFLEQAGLKWTPARLIHLCIMAFAAGMAAAWVLLPIPLALDFVAGLVIAPFPFLYVWYQRRSRLRKFEAIFPETLEFISRSMRAGHAFSVSLEMIYREFGEPVSGEFRRTFEEANLGLAHRSRLAGLSQARSVAGRALLCIRRAAAEAHRRQPGRNSGQAGLCHSRALQAARTHSRGQRPRTHDRDFAELHSRSPSPILMFYTNPEYVKFFFEDQVGNIMMGAAVGLQLIGYLIMKKIVNIEV